MSNIRTQSLPSPSPLSPTPERRRTVSFCGLAYTQPILNQLSTLQELLPDVHTSVRERALQVLQHIPLEEAVITMTNEKTYSSVKIVLPAITLHVGHDSVLIESGKHRTLHHEFVVGVREPATAWKRICYKNWNDLLAVLVAYLHKTL